jgi:hypothetical protein
MFAEKITHPEVEFLFEVPDLPRMTVTVDHKTH